MSALRLIYLIAAIVGAVIPSSHLVTWLQTNSADIGALITLWKATPATAALYYDLLISAAVLSFWIVVEVYARRDYWRLVCLPVIWLIGVSCALPLYLFLRTRPVT